MPTAFLACAAENGHVVLPFACTSLPQKQAAVHAGSHAAKTCHTAQISTILLRSRAQEQSAAMRRPTARFSCGRAQVKIISAHWSSGAKEVHRCAVDMVQHMEACDVVWQFVACGRLFPHASGGLRSPGLRRSVSARALTHVSIVKWRLSSTQFRD